MIQARERQAVLPLVLAVDRQRVALIVRAVGPLLLHAGLEGLIGIGERAVGGVLGASPGVGERAGKAVHQGMLHTDLQSVGNDARAGQRCEISYRSAEQVVADLLGRGAVGIAVAGCSGGEIRDGVQRDAAVAADACGVVRG